MELAVLKGSQDDDNVIISRVPYAIGRCRTADYIIAHTNVSRNHCKIVKEDGLWKIHDFSSSGTYVNDELVGQGKSTTLNNGDRIRFGHFESNLCRTFHSFDGSNKNSIDSSVPQKSSGCTDNFEKHFLSEIGNRTLSFKQNHVPEGSQEALKHFDPKVGQTDEKLKQITETNISRSLNEQHCSKDYSNSGKEKNVEESIESERLEELAKELQQVRKALSNLEEKNSLFQGVVGNVETNNKTQPSSEKNLLKNLADLMETEFQCTICSELFVKAVTLSCTHSFCKYCIDQWKRKQKTCPVCRKKITNETQSLVIDNYIDKMVGNLSLELKERREAIIKERNEIGPFRKRSKLKG